MNQRLFESNIPYYPLYTTGVIDHKEGVEVVFKTYVRKKHKGKWYVVKVHASFIANNQTKSFKEGLNLFIPQVYNVIKLYKVNETNILDELQTSEKVRLAMKSFILTPNS